MPGHEPPSPESIDGFRLRLGAFEETVKCQEAFREGFYKPTVIEVNKVGNGHQASGEVARRICVNYRDSDGDIAMDTQTLEREIDELDTAAGHELVVTGAAYAKAHIQGCNRRR
ncbi:hypothetical protein [Natronoglycomyces albus]|uniref:Uncharacterized protein n=1 Tax=Natronoglycomyces albus TaxID=2811108 RepID=A0A895XTZ5_9ACTN|nr:hypothetical protein [Natronoglycomyces albus]QSB05118.1 hypothetical protein JQS30_15375 [Natronoglycomyces albus]